MDAAPPYEQCESLPDHTVALLGGAPFCVPKDPSKCTIKCKPLSLKPLLSVDPNVKAGRLGAGNAHSVSDRSPFTYTVYFENLETATAPAQEVVVTDELDVLGPLKIGNFLNALVSFGLKAARLYYFIVVPFMRFTARLAPPPAPPSATESLLTDIRDLLKKERRAS